MSIYPGLLHIQALPQRPKPIAIGKRSIAANKIDHKSIVTMAAIYDRIYSYYTDKDKSPKAIVMEKLNKHIFMIYRKGRYG